MPATCAPPCLEQDFKTTQSLRILQPAHGLAEVVGVVAGAAEFERALYLRVSDKVPLFEVNKSSLVRFPCLEVKPGKQKPVRALRVEPRSTARAVFHPPAAARIPSALAIPHGASAAWRVPADACLGQDGGNQGEPAATAQGGRFPAQ